MNPTVASMNSPSRTARKNAWQAVRKMEEPNRTAAPIQTHLCGGTISSLNAWV